MKYFLSWGAGVNSTSLIAAHMLGLTNIPIKDLIIVFCDTGAETIETYQFLSKTKIILRNKGYEIHSINPIDNPEYYRNHIKGKYLTDFLLEKAWVLYPTIRICTEQWKSVPMRRFMKAYTGAGAFYKQFCRHMLSIAADEKHRAIKYGKKFFKYPLIDLDIDRAKGIDLIKAAGLPAAHKTGCFLCPMCPDAAIFENLTKHPEYIDIIEKIEFEHHKKSKILTRNFFGKQGVRLHLERITAIANTTGFQGDRKRKEQEKPYL